jgi:hypothetical protein
MERYGPKNFDKEKPSFCELRRRGRFEGVERTLRKPRVLKKLVKNRFLYVYITTKH